MNRQQPPGYPYYPQSSQIVTRTGNRVGFGSGFTPGQLAVTGIVSYAIVRALGASVPGAIVMGIGNMMWEAGSVGIPAGWKRYVLGLFRTPE